MKIYGFYFFATLVFMISPLGMYHVDALAYLYIFATGVVALAPLRMTRQCGESNWVRVFLLAFPLGAWMTFIRWVWGWALDEGFVPSSTLFETFSYVAGVISAIGYLCFVVGCFGVKAPPLQHRFRQMAWFGIVFFVVKTFFIPSLRPQQVQGWGSLLSTLVTDVLFVPLLLLEYQFWKHPPVEDQLKAAVDAIGLPEES